MERARADRVTRAQVERVEAYLSNEEERSGEPPVLVFNASTRINTLSLNAAFSLLTSWSLRAAGTPVRYVVCHAGMHQCMLGTHWSDLTRGPPCTDCVSFSNMLYPQVKTRAIELDDAIISRLHAKLSDFSLRELERWTHDGMELGRLCLPTVRWSMRQHRLPDDPLTRGLFRQYLASAVNLAEAFDRILDESAPSALVVFNGITYPEAIVRKLALARDIPVITHEVALQPISAFFSRGHATFREVQLPAETDLPPDWNSELDHYLEQRRAGQFSMAGIRFWSEIQPLPAGMEERLKRFSRVVTIFTNVIFDTSQVHADTLFSSMFDWLDSLKPDISEHPETLFVIRAHPDEDRPGKSSRESVADWFAESGLEHLPNVAFVGPREAASSYELIDKGTIVLVYSSSVGLEAAIAGKPVLCAGRARYTQAGAAYFPSTREEYREQLKRLLAEDQAAVPSEFAKNGRRFLYQELFRASLDFSEFLRPHPNMRGMVLFNDFSPSELMQHTSLQAIRRGILNGEPFVSTQKVMVG